MDQKEIWETRTQLWSNEEVRAFFSKPKNFQIEFSELLKTYSLEGKKVIEVGCELGVTSFLLPSHCSKTLLDFNSKVLDLSRFGFAAHHQSADFVTADMFKIPFADGTFDLVFNAGVIEHYTFEERLTLLREYSRVLKKGGKLVIAYPNHYSFPYRWGYLALKFARIFPFPAEFKIYSLKDEAVKANLKFEDRVVLSKGSYFEWLSGKPLLLKLLKLFASIVSFEGYLAVSIMTK